ncbi:MAG TPA: YibE/F family protein [Thermoleophilaceae bacterium]|nr:YibE/F family protein [Thermoleophilaceae bacterium]
MLVAAVAFLALATVVGLVALWPDGGRPETAGGPAKTNAVDAKVVTVQTVDCRGPQRQDCRRAVIEVDGRRSPITFGPVESAPDVEAGEDIRVAKVDAPPGAVGSEPYSFVGRDRRGALIWLTAIFAAIVVALTRWRGVLALGGFALSLGLVTQFIVPAIAQGESPMGVAIVGSFAVMFVTVGLTYGLTAQSAAAALGIAGSLLFAAVLGSVSVDAVKLDGYGSEFSSVLSQSGSDVSLQGIVIAGLVIGALGVLADMAVTQASAVMALRRANPAMTARELFAAGFGVGRDHLVATTHTLVLAYVGAALPLLLVLYAVDLGTVDAINSEDVAEPIVATLVGAISLLISVPVTTALATLVVAHVPADTVPEDHHGHAH